MTTAVLLARLLLAGVFVVSGIAKLRDRAGSRQAVQDFGVPTPLVPAVAGGLPFLELGTALLLLCADPATTAGAVLALLMLVAFTVAIVVNLLRGNLVDCHCFGQVGASAIGWSTVARNGALLVLTAIVLAGAGGIGSVPAVLADYSGGDLAVGIVMALLAAAVAALGLALKTLMGRYGTVLLRLEALESHTGLAAAKLAPHFALPDLDGDVVDLDEVLGAGRPVLVAFISPTCTLCEQLLPDFEQWQADGESLSVLVLSSGTAEDVRTKLGSRDVRVLLHDEGVAAEYEMQGTPAAYLLGVDGLIAGPTAYGIDAVRALHARTVQTVAGHDHGPELHQLGVRPVTPGDALPDVDVELESGTRLALAEAVGQDAVLVFWRSTCGFCAAMVDDLARVETDVRVLLVTGTPIDELRATGLTSEVLREQDSALSSAFQVPGTPSAVRIRGGVVDSAVAIGGPPVLQLLQGSVLSGVLSD